MVKMAMDAKLVAIDKVIPYHHNIKKHPEAQVNQLASMIAAYGWDQAIVCDKDMVIIKGHGRLAAAQKLGLKEVPVTVRDDLTPAQCKAARIADNKVAESEWDLDNLKLEITELGDLDFDLDLTGFDDDFISGLTETKGTEGLTDPDDVPENVETRCKPGDLWILGEHRLLCGDSTNVQHVERLMNGEKADMVFTDPPYGMKLDTDWSKGMTLAGGKPMQGAHSKLGHKGKRHDQVIGDHNDFSPDLIQTILAINCEETFIWGADYFAEHLPQKNEGSWVVWDKRYAADGPIKQAMSTSEFELCWSRTKHQRLICRMVHSGICSVENDKRVHPTQKPVKLAEWFFERWGKPNDLVVDLFLGSGSTLIACEKTGRKCRGMEIDPGYCDVILARWEKFTGKQAVLSE